MIGRTVTDFGERAETYRTRSKCGLILSRTIFKGILPDAQQRIDVNRSQHADVCRHNRDEDKS
jgi:hypothetical protein